MPKPAKFSYEKKAPFWDAFYFILVCEGANREIDYFRFFEGLSSRVRIVPVTNPVGGAPRLLIEAAIAVEAALDARADRDKLWFVVDTDRWREQLHELRTVCQQWPHWQVAQSNPCFEVWLYFHAKANLPDFAATAACGAWKAYLPTVIKGGFNADFHPVAIETAMQNAQATYTATGYFPYLGSTQVWQLAIELVPLIQQDLNALKGKFPAPVLLD